jgi:hypothetical protein
MRNNDKIKNVELINTEEESVVAYLSFCPGTYLEESDDIFKQE